MYNCNFEAINSILIKRMKKLGIIYLMLWIRLGKSLLYYVYVKNFLLLFVTSLTITVCKNNYCLRYKQDNLFLLLKAVFTICILNFFSASFSTQPHPFFVFLQFEGGSEKNILELSNEVLLSETKLNHLNIKAMIVYLFVKKTNI